MGDMEELDLDDESLEDPADCPSDLIPFRLAERKLLKRIGTHLRNNLSTLDAESIQSAAKVLFCLSRLPWETEGMNLDTAFVSEPQSGLSFIGFEINQGEFKLYTGGYDNGPLGGDSEMTSVFHVEAGGFREGTSDDFLSWLEAFEAQGGELKIDDYDESPIPSLPEVDIENGWKRLAVYWEENPDIDDL